MQRFQIFSLHHPLIIFANYAPLQKGISIVLLLKQLNSNNLLIIYVLSNLMIIFKNQYTSIEKQHFISFFSNDSYLLMACVHLFGATPFLESQNQTKHHHPHFLFHIDFSSSICFFITATVKNTALQRYDIVRSNVMCYSVEAVN